MNIIKLYISFCLLLVTTIGISEPSHKLTPFSSESLKLIKQHNTDQPFILLLWSLDCPPCYEELEYIANSDQSLIEFIIITTDDISRAQEAQEVLNEFKISSNNLWIFSSQNKERLIYSIDPQWRGELPRSYLYYGDELRDFHSGILTHEKLKEWIQQSNNST